MSGVVVRALTLPSAANRDFPVPEGEREEPRGGGQVPPTLAVVPPDPPRVIRIADSGSPLTQGLYRPSRQERPAAVAPERQPWPRTLPRDPVKELQAAPAPNDRQQLVEGLRAAGFRPVTAEGPVQRWRLDNARALGYPGAVNVMVPQTFSRSAPSHLYLHGFMLDGGGNLDAQVFGRSDQRSFPSMLNASGTQGVAIMPESPGQNALFNSQWSGAEGQRRFDTFMRNMARTTVGSDRFTSASLSTHSGSGLLGDRLVLGTAFGRDVRFRGHFDDGYGTRDWMTRYNADRAIAARGGVVLSLARTPSFRDHIGEGSNHMNAAAWYDRTGQEPRFQTRGYTFVRRDGSTGHGSDTHIIESQRLPTRPMADFTDAALPERITRFNVTTRNHWEPINAWQTLLRMTNP